MKLRLFGDLINMKVERENFRRTFLRIHKFEIDEEKFELTGNCKTRDHKHSKERK
jgi:hypothetical protein